MTTCTEMMPNVLNALGQTVMGDRPSTHGEFGAFAETFNEIHRAYIAGVLRAGRELRPDDAFAMQIVQKLARLANGTVPNAEHFHDIGGYGVGGAAYLLARVVDIERGRQEQEKAQAGARAEAQARGATLTGRADPGASSGTGGPIPGSMTDKAQRVGEAVTRTPLGGEAAHPGPAFRYTMNRDQREPDTDLPPGCIVEAFSGQAVGFIDSRGVYVRFSDAPKGWDGPIA